MLPTFIMVSHLFHFLISFEVLRISCYTFKNQKCDSIQNGFRIGRSCIDHLFVMYTILRNRKEMGKHTFLCLIDYKKAFDAVNRDLLMFKLLRISINSNIYDAVNTLYSNPRSRVILQDYETD